MNVIPTLTLGPTQILKDQQDIILYLIRSAFLNPGFTSSNMEEQIISFRKLEAEYGENGATLALKLEQEFNAVFLRYFSGAAIITSEVQYVPSDTGKYTLKIEVRDFNNQLKIIRSKVDVINTNELLIDFEVER